MRSDEVLEALEAADDQDEVAGGELRTSRFFIFAVGELQFALPPEAVHEIVSGLEVYPLPACPPYIPGLINSHGTPQTVFDLRVLFANERQDFDKFLVLKLPDDNVAFGCTDVVEIVEVPFDDISLFAEQSAESRFCSALFYYEERRIPVLSVSHILQQLEQDLGG